jgi:hypothetical protein
MTLIDTLREELDSLKTSGEIKNIVAYNRNLHLRLYHPEDEELVEFIRKPIYKVTAKITIPAKGKSL